MDVHRLLVVEDESRLLRYLCNGLGEEGFLTSGVGSAEAAEAAVRRHSFAAIILDLRLPNKDGIEFLRDLRSSGDLTPILILTARDSIEHRVAGLDRGADDYLTKPFAFAELVARVRALLRRRIEPSKQFLRASGLVFDSATRRIKKQDRYLTLSPKETQLLELLMRNAGNLVSRSMIVQALWGDEYNEFSNLIEVFINRVRHKIDESDSSLITTVRGSGYIMRP